MKKWLITLAIVAVTVTQAWGAAVPEQQVRQELAARPAAQESSPAPQWTIAPKGDTIDSPAFCLIGYSKNICNGVLEGGDWLRTECVTPDGIKCRSIMGYGARFKAEITSNPDRCGNSIDATCDETRFNGTLVATLDFQIREQRNCPYRGCYSGYYEIFGDDGIVVANGTMNGTLGVGTHRVPLCITPEPHTCGLKCERCYAVTAPTVEPGTWSFHTEGFINGFVLSGQHEGCSMCVSDQGYFRAKSQDDGTPYTPDVSPWEFCGTADGVLSCQCLLGG